MSEKKELTQEEIKEIEKVQELDKQNFEQAKSQLKPRMKQLSKNSLIDLALRLSIDVTYLKDELTALKQKNQEKK